MSWANPDRMVAPWVAVTAVKRLASAKSRMIVSSRARRTIALAMALDTVNVLSGCGAIYRVLVVSPDPDVAAALASERVQVLSDEPVGGLNAAFSYGIRTSIARYPRHAVAVLPADLPGMTPAALATALELAAARPSTVIADADGDGTVLLTQAVDAQVHPQFGPDSFTRHVAGGAHPLVDGRLQTMRHDIDTADDLFHASPQALGPLTRTCLDQLRLLTTDISSSRLLMSAPSGAAGDRGNFR
jgi:2-phospho-L-lactate/phosphoenolpyruvate guanylyltransferase